MNDIRDDTRAGFTAVFGGEPAGLWSAPGTLTLGGDRAAEAIAIAPRTVVALGLRDDAVARIASSYADELVEFDLAALATAEAADLPSGWPGYVLGVAWALAAQGADLAAVPGFDLFIESDVPVHAGLGSSAALQTAVAVALADVWRLGLADARGRMVIAELCLAAERATVGERGGLLPLVTALFATTDSAVRIDGSTVPLGFAERTLVLLLLDSQTADARTSGMRADLVAETARAAGALEVWPKGDDSAIALVPLEELSRVQVAIDGAFSEHGYGPPDTFVVTAAHGASREP